MRGRLALGVALIFSLLVLPRLCRQDMFVDGVTYAAIARNMALYDSGHAWELSYLKPGVPDFFEHPPLAFWTESFAFGVLGDTPAVERLFCLMLGAALLGSLAALWRSLGLSTQVGAWWPCLIVVMAPRTGWIYANHVLEAWLAPLDVAVVACFCRVAMGPLGVWSSAALGGIASLLTVAAGLVKGAQGLFVLVGPVVLLMVLPHARLRLVQMLWTYLGGLGVAALWLAWYPPARSFLRQYIHQQLWASLTGQREHVGSHSYILLHLVAELALPVCMTLAIKKWVAAPEHCAKARSAATVCFALAAAGSLPVALSPKQSGWYVYQAMPLFAAGLAALACESAGRVERYLAVSHRMRLVNQTVVGCAALLTIVCRMQWQQIARDRDVFALLPELTARIPFGSDLHVRDPRLLSNWSLAAHLARVAGVRLTLAAEGTFALVEEQATAAAGASSTSDGPSRYRLERRSPLVPGASD